MDSTYSDDLLFATTEEQAAVWRERKRAERTGLRIFQRVHELCLRPGKGE